MSMRKIGRRRVEVEKYNHTQRKCASCGGPGMYHVTFEDNWGKLVVVLCEDCSDKPYEELRLQSRIDWPEIT